MNSPVKQFGWLATALLVAAGPAQAQGACGSLENAYGPFDYRSVRGQELRLVERAHFGPSVEALISGKNRHSPPGPEIDYTLRAFPNQHRALLAMSRLGERHKTPQPPGSRYTIECWLTRAISFQPDDVIVQLIYGKYLYASGRDKEASAMLDRAVEQAGDNGFTHYNIGLIYFDAKKYDLALAQAHKAQELGFERAELKQQLEKVGQWRAAALQTPSKPGADAKPQ